MADLFCALLLFFTPVLSAVSCIIGIISIIYAERKIYAIIGIIISAIVFSVFSMFLIQYIIFFNSLGNGGWID